MNPNGNMYCEMLSGTFKVLYCLCVYLYLCLFVFILVLYCVGEEL